MRVEIYGGGPHSGRAEFTRALTAQCKALRLTLTVTRPTRRQKVSPERVSIVFAEKSTVWQRWQTEALAQLVADDEPVLPVIGRSRNARYLPKALRPINAFKKSDYGRFWVDSLVDETLSIAWLRRRTRKVFISYRRVDSGEVANQIFHRFSALGYEVFLDDASINRGADFQRELKWWLNDADLLLVLPSPRFPDSKWCMEEISFAQARTIGVAAVAWPREVYGAKATVRFASKRGWKKPVVLDAIMSDQRAQLTIESFEGATAEIRAGREPHLTTRSLTPAALERVVALCARQRAVAIRQRLDNLIPLVQEMLSQRGRVARAKTLGDLRYRDHRGRSGFVRVLPFRPRPETIREAYDAAGGSYLSACAYAESDPSDPRASALRWLGQKTQAVRGLPRNTAVWAFCGDRAQ